MNNQYNFMRVYANARVGSGMMDDLVKAGNEALRFYTHVDRNFLSQAWRNAALENALEVAQKVPGPLTVEDLLKKHDDQRIDQIGITPTEVTASWSEETTPNQIEVIFGEVDRKSHEEKMEQESVIKEQDTSMSDNASPSKYCSTSRVLAQRIMSMTFSELKQFSSEQVVLVAPSVWYDWAQKVLKSQ